MKQDNGNFKHRIQDYLNACSKLAFFDHIVIGSRVAVRHGQNRGLEGVVIAVAERPTLSRNGYYYVVVAELEDRHVVELQAEYLDVLNPMYAVDYKRTWLGDDEYNPSIHNEDYLLNLQMPVSIHHLEAAE